MSSRLDSLTRSRRGSVTPLTVLSLTLLLGVVAVVVDGGMLMEERRHVQAAADAAALAAAADLYANYSTNNGADSSSGTALASAQATAAANGFSNDGVQSVVTVNISPAKYQSGPNAGKALPAGYVEVIVQYNAGRLFSNIFGSGALPVYGRAVARGQWLPSSNNVMALNTTASGAVNISGGLNIGGGLLINSGSGTALTTSLFSTLKAVTASVNNLVGGLLNFLLSLLLGSTPVTHAPTIADPLRYLPAPDPVQLALPVQGTNLNLTSGNTALWPGIYNGGITIGQGASVTLHANANGTPGIYFLQGGGLNVSGSSSLTMVNGETAGVMVYNNWQTNTDNVSLNTSGSVVLTPPASGSYQGLTLFQKRGTSTTAAPTLTIVGGSNLDITGTIYVAYGNVTLTGVGTNNMGGQIVADTVNSNGTVNVNPQGKPIARERKLGLVE